MHESQAFLDGALRCPDMGRPLHQLIDERCAELGVIPADAARQMGVDASQVSRWLKGASVSERYVPRVAEWLGITEDEVVLAARASRRSVSDPALSDRVDALELQVSALSGGRSDGALAEELRALRESIEQIRAVVDSNDRALRELHQAQREPRRGSRRA